MLVVVTGSALRIYEFFSSLMAEKTGPSSSTYLRFFSRASSVATWAPNFYFLFLLGHYGVTSVKVLLRKCKGWDWARFVKRSWRSCSLS